MMLLLASGAVTAAPAAPATTTTTAAAATAAQFTPLHCYWMIFLTLCLALFFLSCLQFLGVVAVSGSGVLTGVWAQNLVVARPIAENIAGIMAAAVVTLLARFFGHMHDHNYFIYLATGIQTLVPGGIGVRGMSDMWSGDMQGGIVFTFKMCLVGVSLAMGVFLAIIPRGIWVQLNRRAPVRNIPLGESRSGRVKIFRDPNYGSFQSDDCYSYHDDIPE
jgi:uncharacterized membrane protein YjjB (DUF3815 family)